MRNPTMSRAKPHTPVPRGIARSGPAILSYGFRPFFLLAGLDAVVAMRAWLGALSGAWSVGGAEGPIAWHAHEMLFGYTAAALGGFILTAVPNWTGRLPVSGPPLAALVGLWLLGRVASFAAGLVGPVLGAGLDLLFLPVLALVVAREVVAGRNWQNLRVTIGISALAALNIAFHVVVALDGDPAIVFRGAVTLYMLLVCLIGGRIIPSFTRNYLAKRGDKRLPAPAGRFDQVALAIAAATGLVWAIWPDSPLTIVLCAAASLAHTARLARWRGLASHREPLLLVLHVAYAFVPIGFAMLALSGLGIIAPASALHVVTVGVIGMTTLAVMTRTTRGHTGRPLTASPLTTTAYVCLFAVALLRPLADLFPDAYHALLALSGLAWLLAYGLFVIEHAPMLLLASASGRK
jgi:uncharacterized protein involved in response to NO